MVTHNTADQALVDLYHRKGWAPVPWAHHPPEVIRAIKAAHLRPGIKVCWRNCQLLLLTQDVTDFRYFEGIVLPHDSPVPCQHAWLTIRDGPLVDLTLKVPPKIIIAYERTKAAVRENLLRTKIHGPVDPVTLDLAETCAYLGGKPEDTTPDALRAAIAKIQKALDDAATYLRSLPNCHPVSPTNNKSLLESAVEGTP